jgi:hypothetical protein
MVDTMMDDTIMGDAEAASRAGQRVIVGPSRRNRSRDGEDCRSRGRQEPEPT